jgi:hypothetical protein
MKRIPFQKRWRAVWVFEKCSRCGMGITDLGGDWEVTTTGAVICEVCAKRPATDLTGWPDRPRRVR